MKRTLCLLLALALLLGVLPVFASAAADANVWDGTVDVSWYDPAASEYHLSTPAQLAGLAALVNGMTDPGCPKIIGRAQQIACIQATAYPGVTLVGAGGGNVSDTVYCSQLDFAYKTVYLTADMDLGGVYDAQLDAWSGPNWTPIGGKYPMLPQEAAGDCLTLDTRFNGVLDGQGHTISNLYCDRFAEKGFPYSMAIGLVGYLGGAGDVSGITADFEDVWQPAVRNLVLASGSVYGRRMVGGVVGRIGETSNGVIVENCANFAQVKNTDSKGVGGIVGSGWGDGVIRNCYNAGSVSTTFSCPAGGICASNSGMDIYNCYNIGTIATNGEKKGRGIGGHDAGTYTVANCYTLSGCDDDPDSGGYYKGVSQKISISVQCLSQAELQASELIDALNANGSVFAADTLGVNGGYPILWFQAGGGGDGMVTLTQPDSGGTISASAVGTVRYGQAVQLTAAPLAGWTLKTYTANGAPIQGDFYCVSGDVTLGAVFSQVRENTISISGGDSFYLSVTRTGWRLEGDAMVWAQAEPLRDGDTVLEENLLTLEAHGYDGAAPEDPALEYTGSFTYTVTGADPIAAGVYQVTGEGPVTVRAQGGTQARSWLSAADLSWYNPFDGQTVYTLHSAEQLAGLAYYVNVLGYDFQGVTLLLDGDISLSSDGGVRVWQPIGSGAAKPFRGDFDGQGHAISGLSVCAQGSYAGLFGYCVDASIQNLTLRGEVQGLASASYAAGIAAYADATVISGCENRANVAAAGTFAGGIAAQLTGGSRVTDCANYGAVTGTSGVGGIAGVVNTGDDLLSGCANFGPITGLGSGTYGVGGIAGRLAGTMDGCGNAGAIVSADRYTGGLAGYATTRYTSMLLNSRSAGTILAENDAQTAAAGGLVGYGQNLIMKNCVFTGTLDANTAGSGSDVGRFGSVELEPCSDLSVIPDPQPREDTYQPGFVYPTAADVQPLVIPDFVGGGDVITQSGTYALPWNAAGTVSIADGLTVTLDGSLCSALTGLAIAAGTDVRLTLRNVCVTSDHTLLTMDGGVLCLEGDNYLSSTSDAANNRNPAVALSGDIAVCGTGSLAVSAGDNTAAVTLAAGGSFRLESGALTVEKTGKLGFAGGAFYAPACRVSVTGGQLTGHTSSDNVAILSAQTIAVSGGVLRLWADKSPLTLQAAELELTGGSILSSGHDADSAQTQQSYWGALSVSGLTDGADFFAAPLPFSDLSLGDACYDAVARCREQGWLTGVTEAEFQPEAALTRAMLVTALYRLAGQPEVTDAATDFTDLNQAWYQDAVCWAVDRGLAQGVGDHLFAPDAALTLEQAAVFLWRYAQLAGADVAAVNQPQLYAQIGDVSSWAGPAVYWAVSADLFADSDAFLSPTANVSRGRLAVALTRLEAYIA